MGQEEFYPVALTIAGSDSGGGAGVQADLRTFNAAGVYAASVITAVTAQNPLQVTGVAALESDIVKLQLETVFAALAIKAAKTGMLANGKIVHTVAEFFRKKKLPLIVDPVMISTSGAALLDKEGMQLMKDELLPLAAMITPNIPEAEYLTGRKLATQNECITAALQLSECYKCHCVLKGGHAAEKNQSSDIVVLDGEVYSLSSPRVTDISSCATHGTGCTFSSAITAMIAGGSSWKDALKSAKAHVYGSLNELAPIGRDLEAMYPPLGDYSKEIALRKINNRAALKGGKNAR